MITILTNQRSGSHLLSSLISANGYRNRNEVVEFAKRKIMENHTIDTLYKRPDLQRCPEESKRICKKKIQSDLIPTIRELLTQDSVSILHRYQISYFSKDATPENEIKKINTIFRNAKFVYLTRDIMDSAISYYIARHNGSWFSYVENRTVKVPLTYNFQAIKKIYDNYSDNLGWPQSVLDGLKSVHVTYEDLVSNTQATMEKLGNDLGVSFSVFSQDSFQKQNDPRKAEYKAQFLDDLKKGNMKNVNDIPKQQ